MRRTSMVDLIERDLGIGDAYLRELAEGADALYASRKLKGRAIEVPSAELKLVQCWISDFLRSVDSCLPAFVTAYEKGCSVVANATVHCDQTHLLSLDIKDFFHSCKCNLVWRMFSGLLVDFDGCGSPRRMTVDEIDLLVALTCFKGALSVGAPSSPAIANRIMLPIDCEIAERIPPSLKYSRYSDDMTFSSMDWINVQEVVDLVSEVLSADGFRLNERKMRCAGRGDRRAITGIVVQPNGSLSIGLKRKRRIKQELYSLLVHGKGDPLVLLGKIYFAIQVEPAWAANALAKYADYGEARIGGVIGALRRMARQSS